VLLHELGEQADRVGSRERVWVRHDDGRRARARDSEIRVRCEAMWLVSLDEGDASRKRRCRCRQVGDDDELVDLREEGGKA
jgi:hypothetical protein